MLDSFLLNQSSSGNSLINPTHTDLSANLESEFNIILKPKKFQCGASEERFNNEPQTWGTDSSLIQLEKSSIGSLFDF